MKLAILYLALAVAVSATHIAYITRRDTYNMEKYTRTFITTTYVLGLMLYLLAVYYFRNVDNTYMLHIMFGIIMLVCLPAALFSVSVATIIGGNV